MPLRSFWRGGTLALASWMVLFGLALGQSDEAIEARMRKDVTYLASEECEGRGVDTAGIQKAATYIAAEFTKAGLKPGGVDGTFFQPFTISGAPKLEGKSTLTLKGPLGQEIELKLNDDFQVMGFSGPGKVTAPLVFVGYGVTAPKIDYDDYKGIDVAGKIALAIRRTPRFYSKELSFDGANKEQHAALVNKESLAESNKAAGFILVNDLAEAGTGDKLMAFKDIAGAAAGTIPAVQLRRTVADAILQTTLDTNLAEVEKSIDRDLKPRSAPLKGWTATIETTVKRTGIACKNVIGVLEGAGPLANETVVVGAHYDHLGYGGQGSLAKKGGPKQMHPGADDNGSGTTTVMELARRFGAMKDRQGRRLVFMTFSGEERGLLGSQYYCNRQPLFPLAETVAMVNLDMVGRFDGKLIVEGVGTAKNFDDMVKKLEKQNPGIVMTKKPGGLGPSDHDSFCKKNIPVFFFWTGTHPDYHRPGDTADKINVSGMRIIAGLTEKVIADIAAETKRPEFVKVPNTFNTAGGRGSAVKLGITPNYEEEKEGVLVGGVADNGPASNGGIKAGDLIVEIAGKSVTNLETYMVVMAQQKSGQALDVAVIRAGKKMTLKVTPQ